MKREIIIPADIPPEHHERFAQNYRMITHNTDHLFVFTGDHKIEHLNEDFQGADISPDAGYPDHLFNIAQHGSVGAFATQLGLITRYGNEYPHIPYIVKLNSKTNLIPRDAQDPLSSPLCSVDDVLKVQSDSGLSICGVGYTIYLGSSFEANMLTGASQAVLQAHRAGLVALLWVYPRGKYVPHEHDLNLLAGAAGVAAALGADFVKLPLPHAESPLQKGALAPLIQAAGNTKIIASGGTRQPSLHFLEWVSQLIHEGVAGVAVGRNIYQHDLAVACSLTDAVSALIYHNADLASAQAYLRMPRNHATSE
jgi:fructose-bisphosphate aldolase/6-deoxy-5-ketofructose 1-phosphate synthase